MINKELNKEALAAARYEMTKSTVWGDKLENAIQAYLAALPQPDYEAQVEAVARAIYGSIGGCGDSFWDHLNNNQKADWHPQAEAGIPAMMGLYDY